MSKKKKPVRETTIENYYDLKVDKVDELVAALKGEAPRDDNDLTMFISVWLKAIFIKWWFAGAVCYFILVGLQNVIKDPLDMIAFTGITLGLVVEVLVNPLFRYLERGDKEYAPYMMFPFPFKAYWTFFTNIIYYVLVAACVNGLYLAMNLAINALNGTQAIAGVEPLLFGVFFVVADMLFIGIKDLAVYLVGRNAKERANV